MARFQRIPMNRTQLLRLLETTSVTSEPRRVCRLDRKSTAQECFTDFLQACQQVFHDNNQNMEVMLSMGVGLKPENRSSVYDLIWYPKQPRYCYCADIKDPEFVYRLDLKLGEQCSCCAHKK